MTRALVIGSGGREHALAWGLARSPEVDDLFCAPGNLGMAALGECRPVRANDPAAVVALAERPAPRSRGDRSGGTTGRRGRRRARCGRTPRVRMLGRRGRARRVQSLDEGRARECRGADRAPRHVRRRPGGRGVRLPRDTPRAVRREDRRPGRGEGCHRHRIDRRRACSSARVLVGRGVRRRGPCVRHRGGHDRTRALGLRALRRYERATVRDCAGSQAGIRR